ncbi:MAG: Mobile element protein, partial [uncultured Gemmatimonadaceae bacterium]
GVPQRPHRPRVGDSRSTPTGHWRPRASTHPRAAARARRRVLRAPKWVRVAHAPGAVPAVAHRVLPLPAVAPARRVGRAERRAARARARRRGTRAGAVGGGDRQL